MVAVIKPGHSLHRVFNYNENKVKEGEAVCIGAENFPLNAEEMSLKVKLGYLLKRVKLNENVQRNSVHISLNFHPSESHFSKEKLLEIAAVYMQKLGFGQQPYLVYQHHDAGHPHIHLVTTNIQADGKRIDLHHLGIRKSEPARKEIEKMFDLVPAEKQQKRQAFQVKPVDVRKVQYGRTETKRAINNVLDAVLSTYKYTSLPELNAILKQYNIIADRGSEQSRMFKGGGLVYRILDETGKPVGVPIKASDFYNKPILKCLEEKYSQNDTKRQPYKARVKNEIDRLFLGNTLTLEELVRQLERKGIYASLRKSDSGFIYGITYVDHQTKCVFNGSVLGKQYSAKAIQERCGIQEIAKPPLSPVKEQEAVPAAPFISAPKPGLTTASKDIGYPPAATGPGRILDDLMQPEQAADYVPGALKKRSKKKKKRKNISNNQ